MFRHLSGRWAPLLLAVFCNLPISAAPLEAYGRLPNLEDVTLSPDGSKLAFVQTNGDSRTVVVTTFPERKVLGELRVGEQKLRSLDWADDDALMIETSVTMLPWFMRDRGEWVTMQVYRPSTRKTMVVPDGTQIKARDLSGDNTMNVIAGRVMVRQIDGHTVLFATGYCASDGQLVLGLYRADLNTGSQQLLRQGSPATRSFLVDSQGQLAAELRYDNQHRHWSLLANRDNKLQEISAGDEAIDYPSLWGFGPNGDSLLISSNAEQEQIWTLLSLADGSSSSPGVGHAFDEPIDDPGTHRMIGTVTVDDDAHYKFFDRSMQARWDGIARAFAGAHVRLISWNRDFSRVIVQVDGSDYGYLYESVDMQTHKAEPLGDVYTGVTMPPMSRRITYTAADGLDIPAYLTLPRNASKSLPLIVLPHGGPAASDTAEFDWWSAALADQGYAVLRPNFRGSDLNWQFMSRGFGEFGRKMQSDLSDGVRYLAQQGTIDPARVCIVGASYGGYAALAAATLEPDTYRCVVSVAGISDLHRFLREENGDKRDGATLTQRYWNRFLNVTGADDPQLDAISPIKHVAAVQAPVLLIHGRDDTVVPFEQSTVMLEALQRAHKNVHMVILKHEDHWLSHGETRLQMLQESVAFLRANNPPNGP